MGWEHFLISYPTINFQECFIRTFMNFALQGWWNSRWLSFKQGCNSCALSGKVWFCKASELARRAKQFCKQTVIVNCKVFLNVCLHLNLMAAARLNPQLAALPRLFPLESYKQLVWVLRLEWGSRFTLSAVPALTQQTGEAAGLQIVTSQSLGFSQVICLQTSPLHRSQQVRLVAFSVKFGS